MTGDKLTWNNCDAPIDDARVHEVEQRLNVRFPDDYCNCIKKYHGGTPTPQRFTMSGGTLGEFGSSISVLLSLADENGENILNMYEWTSDQMPRRLIPFGLDGGGDLICFDYTNQNSGQLPKVVYWHRTGLPGNELFDLSGSFSDFLGLLH